MNKPIRRSIQILRDDGIANLVLTGYRKVIRPKLPTKTLDYNGVDVQNGRLFDDIMPGVEGSRPNYESALVAGLRDVVQPSDTVVIVGGGWGVTAVVAARQLSKNGNVIVYEGSQEQVDHIKTTAELNGVAEKIEVKHAIVGDEIKLKGPAKGAEMVSPESLPECDVLELDCEGAEQIILERMSIRPWDILVETHGHRGAPPSEIRTKLEELSYEIIVSKIATLDRIEICKEKGIEVITATHVTK